MARHNHPHRSHLTHFHYDSIRGRGSADNGVAKMAAMTDSKNIASYNRANAGHTPGGNHGNMMYVNQWAARGQAGQGYGMHQNPSPEIAALAHSFQGMNVQHHQYPAGQMKHGMMPNSAGSTYGGLAAATPMPGPLYTGTNQYGYPASFSAGPTAQSPALYTPHASQYLPQLGYPGYQQQMHQQHHDHSPLSTNWTPTTGGANGELPTLITPRRDSISSNENDQPVTPMYAGYQGYAHSGVAVNRSPSGGFPHTTPSPSSMLGSFGMPTLKHAEQPDVSPKLKLLVSREPAIPRAVPALSSPSKPLDRALENPRGETNVYVRGLLPETTDEMLKAWADRFGDIQSSKSIIDHETKNCKGFGFVKYYNYDDCERCIRGFHYLGYEVSFARESFYSKLKTFANEQSTNLYVSNLPKSMNEHELSNLFAPHVVSSSRIMRDHNGHGRGVGFARFDSRDTCEEVIKGFNNHTINAGGEELQIQIRFADTEQQKSLKQQTLAARQFRSQEYEYATQAIREGRLPYAGSPVHEPQGNHEFDQFLGTKASIPIQNQRWAQSAIRQLPGRSPLGGVSVTASNASQPPLVQINVAPGSEAHGKGVAEASSDTKPASSPSATNHPISPADSANSAHE